MIEPFTKGTVTTMHASIKRLQHHTREVVYLCIVRAPIFYEDFPSSIRYLNGPVHIRPVTTAINLQLHIGGEHHVI